jgi:hypothetical protein
VAQQCGSKVQGRLRPAAFFKVRKTATPRAAARAAAHYTEQMMLDEGYGKGDLKLRLGQLQDALLRNERFIAVYRCTPGR